MLLIAGPTQWRSASRLLIKTYSGDNDKFLLSASSASSLANASDNTFSNNTETNPLSFSNSGLGSNETGTTTFVGPINQNVG